MAGIQARIVISNRNGQILEVGDFRYTRRNMNRRQTKIYWRCIERDTCNGTIITNFNVDAGIVLKLGKRHTHEVSNVGIKVQEVVRAIKRRAADHPNAPPSTIFREEVTDIDDEEIIACLPQKNDVIWKFLEHLRKDQNENEVLIIQLRSGHKSRGETTL